MASLDELDRTLSHYFTLSNKNLLIIAKVCEETIYFNDILDNITTIVLLTEPRCYAIKRAFIEAMIQKGVTVIELKEFETFDSLYKMSNSAERIITNLIEQNTYQHIVTHPRYYKKGDSQNREIFDIVSKLVKRKKSDNHFTYNKIKYYDALTKLDDQTITILKMYSSVLNENNRTNPTTFKNYITTCSNISGIRKVKQYE